MQYFFVNAHDKHKHIISRIFAERKHLLNGQFVEYVTKKERRTEETALNTIPLVFSYCVRVCVYACVVLISQTVCDVVQSPKIHK